MKKAEADIFVPHISHIIFRKCNPEWRMRSNRLRDFNISYIVKGRARYTIDDTVYELEAGDLLFLQAGTEREAFTYLDNPMHVYSINFASQYPVTKTAPPPFPMINHIGLRQDIVDLFRDLAADWAKRSRAYPLKTCALLMLLLYRLSEIILYNTDSDSGDYRIDWIIRYITEHYAEKLTVKKLANIVHLDAVYFGQLFKQKTGMTVHQYILRVRINNAEKMLASGNYWVHEAAERCRFSDVAHFYRSFKALRGFAPSRCIPRNDN
jgi:AraC-like DNA-binding protein